MRRAPCRWPIPIGTSAATLRSAIPLRYDFAAGGRFQSRKIATPLSYWKPSGDPAVGPGGALLEWTGDEIDGNEAGVDRARGGGRRARDGIVLRRGHGAIVWGAAE